MFMSTPYELNVVVLEDTTSSSSGFLHAAYTLVQEKEEFICCAKFDVVGEGSDIDSCDDNFICLFGGYRLEKERG